jgi:hypothetical protein
VGAEINKLASNTKAINVAFPKSPCFAPAGSDGDNGHPGQRITDETDFELAVGVFILIC